tara:strand:- start:299 stop:523 length:225 start_codon:yes stop_codon:yes gene_type:complete
MIYKFKVWVWLPKTTEIYLSAEDDNHALSNFKKLDLKEFKFLDDGIRKSRVTFEIVKDVQIENATHRTVDRFKE